MPEASDSDSPAYLVVGGTSGIGRATVQRLHEAGARQLVVARGEEGLKKVTSEIGCSHMVADVTQSGQANQAAERVIEEFGRLDGVVNCAGSILLKPAHLTSDDDWQETLRLNLTSAFNVLRAAVKTISRAQKCSVVLMSTAAARRGLPNHEAIAAAKAGIIGLGLSAAATYASRGIRVNIVAPGLVRTPLSRGITENQMALKFSTQLHALGRVGEPDDVARAITWLLAPEQSWVTGQVFGIDGGLATVQAKASA